jgi:hypothetical protein
MPVGDVEVLQHAQLFEDRRGLEGTTDAEAHDLVRLHGEQVAVAEPRLAGASHQPREGVDQRGLARTVGADEEVEPTLQQRDVDSFDRLEAVEVDGQVPDLEVVLTEERGGHATASAPTVGFVAIDARLAADRPATRPFSFVPSEAKPPGRNSITTMNSAPWK